MSLDSLVFFFKGWVIGLAIAAPVGPIGLLCIQRTLARGGLVGFVTGLGAASADAVYGFAAAFGLTAISGFLVNQQFWLRLVGGIFLIYLGATAFRKPPAREAAESGGRGLFGAYATTLALTLTNPMTILAFAAIFAGLGLVGPKGDYGTAGLMVVGVFSGSACWWLFLSTAAGLVRRRLQERHLGMINKASGVIITLLGLLALVGAFAG